jgi:hypothetical protein
MRLRLGLPLALALAALDAGGGCLLRPRRSLPPDLALLTRRVEGLRALVALAAQGPLIPADELLVVVDQRLVRGLLRAALPMERTFAGRYRVVLQEADVSFEDGFALVHLAGRASLLDETHTFVELSIFGALTVQELEPASGRLRARVEVEAVDVQRAGVLGVAAPIHRLIADLSHEQFRSYEALLSQVEIPVRLERELSVPGLGPQGGVLLAPLALPLRASVERVVAYRGRLWVSVGLRPAA